MYEINCLFMYFKDLLTYKTNILVFMLYGLLPLISAMVASSIDELLMYYLLAFFVSQIVNGWTANQLAGDITTGKISNILVMPRLLKFTYACSRGAMLLFIAPTLLLVLLTTHFIGISYEGIHLYSGLFSLTISIAIQFNISIILGMLTIWTTQSFGLISLWFSLLLPLSGLMFPLSHLPDWLFNLTLLTPFPYYIYVPVISFQNGTTTPLIFYQISMLIVTILISKTIEVKSLKRFLAYGS